MAAGRDRLLPRARLWGGEKTGPSPVDRRKPGSKHHLITCGRGSPLAVETTAANVNDFTRFVELVDAVPPVRGRRGRPRKRPKEVYGDRAYHSRKAREELRRRKVKTRVAGPGDPHGSGLGRRRWVVEGSGDDRLLADLFQAASGGRRIMKGALRADLRFHRRDRHRSG